MDKSVYCDEIHPQKLKMDTKNPHRLKGNSSSNHHLSVYDFFVAQILKLSSIAMTLSSSKSSGKWFPPILAFLAKRSFSTI